MANRTMNSPDQVSVGIVSAGIYLPERVLTATDIAEKSGLPAWVVREKLGIKEKRMAGPDDHPNQMAIWAAQDCLSNGFMTTFFQDYLKGGRHFRKSQPI